jgi:predicted DNA-binding protein
MARKYKAVKSKAMPQVILPVTMKTDFKKRVHEVASKQYKTAAAYIREAVIEKMKREGDWE